MREMDGKPTASIEDRREDVSPVKSVASVAPDKTNLSDQSPEEIAEDDSDGKEDRIFWVGQR